MVNNPNTQMSVYPADAPSDRFVLLREDENPFGHTPRDRTYVTAFTERLETEMAIIPNGLPALTAEAAKERMRAAAQFRGYENEKSFANAPNMPTSPDDKQRLRQYDIGQSDVDDSLRLMQNRKLRSLELLHFSMPYGRGSHLLPTMRRIGREGAIRFNPEAEYMLRPARIEKLEIMAPAISSDGTVDALLVYARLSHGFVDASEKKMIREKLDSVIRLDGESSIWNGSSSSKLLRKATEELRRSAYDSQVTEGDAAEGWRTVFTENQLLQGCLRRIFEAEYESAPDWLLQLESCTYAVNNSGETR